MKKKYFAFFRCLLIFYATLLAYADVTAGKLVYGKVMDEHMHPLPYVSVTIAGSSQGAETDTSGYYKVIAETDTFSLIFSLVGFQDITRKLSLKDKNEYKFDVVLNEARTVLGEFEKKVIARQSDAAEYIDVEALRTMPGANNSVESLVATQAGVSSNNELSSQYSVRGGNYDENSVYVNHIEIYRPMLISSGEQEGLSFVNPDLVGSIEFSSVGFSSEFGDKMSSVLDIQYKKPKSFEGSLSLSLLGASAYIGSSKGTFTQIHGLRYKSAKYLLGSLEVDGEYNPSFFDYQTYITKGISDKFEVSFLGNISRNKYEFYPQSRKTSFGTMTDVKEFTVYFDGKEEDKFITCFGNVSLTYKPRENVSLSLLASGTYSAENESYDISGEYWLSEAGSNSVSIDPGSGIGKYHEHARNDLDVRIYNISHVGSVKLSDNVIKWGATVQREYIDDRANEWEMRDSAGYSIPVSADNLQMFYNLSSDNSLSSNRLIAYLQDTYTSQFDCLKMILTGGVRLNYWSFNKELLVSPRVSVALFPRKNKNLGFRFATGIYHQAPFYKEIKDTVLQSNGNADVVINKNVLAQRSFQMMLGCDYYYQMWSRPFKFTTEVYGKYIDRINPFSVDNVKIVYEGENKGDGYVMGIDMKLFGEFVPGTDSWVSLSLMQAKENIYGDGAGYISRPTDQLYNFSIFFQDYIPGYDKFMFNLKMSWADGLPFGPPRSQRSASVFRMPDYRRVDIGASYTLKKGRDTVMDKSFLKYLKTVTLGVDVLNLFDISNVNSYYWVTDVTNVQYAVPNYLTSRQINVRLTTSF